MPYLKSRRFLSHLYLIFSLILTVFAVVHQLSTTKVQTVSADTDPNSTLSEEYAFCVREQDTKVIVFDARGNKLFVSEIDPRHLPAADRQMLRDGIYLRDEEALSRLIEDYSS